MRIKFFKRKIPTDLEILDAIYEECYERFASFDKKNPDRKTKIYVPFDLDKIADQLNVDGDIVFGRLYYHLNKKYGYRNPNGSTVSVYNTIPGDGHSINMPLTAAILADLRKENKKFWIATGIAILSLIISIVAYFS